MNGSCFKIRDTVFFDQFRNLLLVNNFLIQRYKSWIMDNIIRQIVSTGLLITSLDRSSALGC